MSGSILYLDSRSAKAIHFDRQNQEKTLSLSKTPELSHETYYESLAVELENPQEVILLGPDEEKSSFRNWLQIHKRHLGRKLIGVFSWEDLNESSAKLFREKYFRT